MFTFADLMRQAQGGQALDNLATVYGLKRSDMEKLTAALLPAFQIGFQRSMQEPATMVDMLDPEKFGAAFEDARAAVSPAVTEAGRMAMERLFGSAEAADVIARQAAQISGVGGDLVSKVMPAMTATLFGGIAKQVEESPFAPMLKVWSGGVDPAANPMGAFANPFKDAMGSFLKGYAEGKPKPEAAAGHRWPEGMEGFGKLFEAGMEVSEQNRRAFEQILDGYRKPG